MNDDECSAHSFFRIKKKRESASDGEMARWRDGEIKYARFSLGGVARSFSSNSLQLTTDVTTDTLRGRRVDARTSRVLPYSLARSLAVFGAKFTPREGEGTR